MRQPKPFYRKQTKSWYVQLGKKQIPLGADERVAWDEYHKLMANRADIRPDVPAVYLLDRYLEWVERNRAPRTFKWYLDFLSSFSEHIGKRKLVRDVRPYHVTDWVDSRPTWNKTTRHCAIRVVKRAFTWGVDEGHIAISPVKSVKRGKAKVREGFITDDHWDRIMGAVGDEPFCALLTFCRHTGVRPEEARIIEARHFDEQTGTIHLSAEESKGEDNPRTIYPDDVALALVEKLAARHPEGPIFRNTKGEPWTASAVVSRFRRLQKKLGIKGLSAYILRHTYITNALANNVDSVVLAKLVGHKDTEMIMTVYSKLAKRPDFMREAAKQATGT